VGVDYFQKQTICRFTYPCRLDLAMNNVIFFPELNKGLRERNVIGMTMIPANSRNALAQFKQCTSLNASKFGTTSGLTA
jgi:hypothetical protein